MNNTYVVILAGGVGSRFSELSEAKLRSRVRLDHEGECARLRLAQFRRSQFEAYEFAALASNVHENAQKS